MPTGASLNSAARSSIARYVLARARPSGVMRSAGITLPGNGSPVSGSRRAPGASRALKSPSSSARVGIERRVGAVWRRMYLYSWPTKKKNLSRRMGPPTAPPKSLKRSFALIGLPEASFGEK